MPTPADPLGHALLARRLAQIPGALAGMLDRPPPPIAPATRAARRFLITGTGSSEAHARHLCALINLHTDRAATFLPLSSFTVPAPQAAWRDKTLVVFSQGLSPNAQLALRRHREFAHMILFTAATPAITRGAGKPERADLLQTLLDSGAELIPFPLAEEYTTLIRFVGPMCGYLAALQFVARLDGCSFAPPRPEQVLPPLDSAPPSTLLAAMQDHPQRFAQGFNLLVSAPVSEYAQNLSCKFMEGLFWRCPMVSDFLQFAHGPFQQTTAAPSPVLILRNNTASDAEFVHRSVEMLRGVAIETHVLHVAADPLFAIFGFEAALNRLVFDLMQRQRTDQINWPGKGRDDLLYGFCPDT
jgi:creatinine amidohydrolase